MKDLEIKDTRKATQKRQHKKVQQKKTQHKKIQQKNIPQIFIEILRDFSYNIFVSFSTEFVHNCSTNS